MELSAVKVVLCIDDGSRDERFRLWLEQIWSIKQAASFRDGINLAPQIAGPASPHRHAPSPSPSPSGLEALQRRYDKHNLERPRATCYISTETMICLVYNSLCFCHHCTNVGQVPLLLATAPWCSHHLFSSIYFLRCSCRSNMVGSLVRWKEWSWVVFFAIICYHIPKLSL